jgi:hypothetical protein
VVAAARGPIHWRIDGVAVGTSDSDGSYQWPLATGSHRIVARDRRGRTAETTVIVR